MARPTKLTTDTADRIIELLEAGATPLVAAPLAGITERTFYLWLDRAASEDEAGKSTIYTAFAARVSTALAKAQNEGVVGPLFRAARNGDIKAAMFLATHRFDWTQTTKTEVTGKDGKDLELGVLVIHPPQDAAD